MPHVLTSMLLSFPLVVAAQLPLPQKSGESFVLEHFDFKVTASDLGINAFSGNMGTVDIPAPAPGDPPIATPSLVPGDVGTGLQVAINFTGRPATAVGGYFFSLMGLTSTKVSLDGSGSEPPTPTEFPGYFLNFNDLYAGFAPWAGRSIDAIEWNWALGPTSTPVKVKVELKDEDGHDLFTRRDLVSTNWIPVRLTRSDFNRSIGSPALFRWDRVSSLSFLVERAHAADSFTNAISSAIRLDNLVLRDDDGLYPDLASAASGSGDLLPQYHEAFLDHLRRLSFLYFIDFASTDPRTGGLIQDRGPFADLMSVGGAGFQLSAYVIGAERGYLSHTSAVDRVHRILTILDTYSYSTNRVGAIGHRGFLYHFLGIDGLRKQNFDFTATAADESQNTVELSSIDTSLALAGVVTVKNYFLGSDPKEVAIREMSERILRRVEWPFLLHHDPLSGLQQVCLGWKPIEPRDDSNARFLLPDALGEGHYSSKWDGTSGTERGATLDYYTDEAALIALLAMASPEESNRLSRVVWDDIIRTGTPTLVKTYPGALFTYQFLSCWVDTSFIGPDNHPRPMDFFLNTAHAIDAARTYAATNTQFASYGPDAWALNACEGPYDHYFAEGAPPVSLSEYGDVYRPSPVHRIEGETGTGDGFNETRPGQASADFTRRLTADGASVDLVADLPGGFRGVVVLAYSNDGPADTVRVSIGTNQVTFTGHSIHAGGNHWSVFYEVSLFTALELPPGLHNIQVLLQSTDTYGWDLDYVEFRPDDRPRRPLDSGTLAPYGAASSVLHRPDESLAALWHMANLDLNGDGSPDLLHPRFGFVDAYNEDIADAYVPGIHATDTNILRTSGPWANPVGFSIDHGPMLIILDNHLDDHLVPTLFMRDPDIHRALSELFPAPPDISAMNPSTPGSYRMTWRGIRSARVETAPSLPAAPADWVPVSPVATNQVEVTVPPDRPFLRVRHASP